MSDYIATDPIAIYKAEAALRDMGKQEYISALLLDGPPGCGKTFLAKILAKKLKAKLMQFQFFPGCGREDLILDLAIGANGNRTPGILLQAMTMSQEGKIVLLLDELDKAEPRVDSFLLTFLNEGSLLVPQLGEFIANRENILVVITKNDDRQAGTALLRRCRTVQMRWPTIEVESAIFRQRFPLLTDEACLSIIDTANRLRSHPDVKKAPASPELMRTISDIIELVRQNKSSAELGYFYIDSLAPIVHDRQHIPDSPTYLGTRIKLAFQEVLKKETAPLPAPDPEVISVKVISNEFPSTPEPAEKPVEAAVAKSAEASKEPEAAKPVEVKVPKVEMPIAEATTAAVQTPKVEVEKALEIKPEPEPVAASKVEAEKIEDAKPARFQIPPPIPLSSVPAPA